MEIFILCIKIFFVRIIDVSLGTVRTMFVVKNKKLISSAIGFFEVLIWFLIVREALAFENNSVFVAISYSLGFATGTFIGGTLAQKFITGNITVQVFTSSSNRKIADKIRKAGYGVTAINYQGINENEQRLLLFININKKKEYELKRLVNELDENAFIIVNESVNVENGYFK